MMQHTPIPWVMHPFSAKYKNEGFCINATDEDATRIADVTNHYYVPSEANAHFIVQACNAHDDLLAVLKVMVFTRAIREHLEETDPMALEQARAAIAKAEGK